MYFRALHIWDDLFRHNVFQPLGSLLVLDYQAYIVIILCEIHIPEEQYSYVLPTCRVDLSLVVSLELLAKVLALLPIRVKNDDHSPSFSQTPFFRFQFKHGKTIILCVSVLPPRRLSPFRIYAVDKWTRRPSSIYRQEHGRVS